MYRSLSSEFHSNFELDDPRALHDLHLITDHFGAFDNLEVVIGGKLRGSRIVRSLACIAAFDACNNSLTFVARPECAVDDTIKRLLDIHDTMWQETDDIHSAVINADIVHWTHCQDNTKQTRLHQEIINQAIMRSINPDAILIQNYQ